MLGLTISIYYYADLLVWSYDVCLLIVLDDGYIYESFDRLLIIIPQDKIYSR